MPSHFKKEGWWGVGLTVLLCAGFLWWWFQPPPVDASTERDPLFWLELARKEFGATEPSTRARFESLVVALSYQQVGKDSVATAIVNDWLPAAWLTALVTSAETRDTRAVTGAPAPDPVFGPLLAKLTEARDLLDRLEVEPGRAVFHEAIAMADALRDPQKSQALWLVAARQARSGFAPDARQSRQRIHTPPDPPSLPSWLISEFIHADMIVPVLAWIETHPADESKVLAELVAVVKDRLLHRESGELASHGPRADPTSTHSADASLLGIHQTVMSNQVRTAGETARRFPRGSARAAGFLTIARTLAWNSERPGL